MEHINNITDWLTSGGHVWEWSGPVVVRKTLGTVAINGAYSLVTHNGQRPGRLAGKNGRPALMKVTAANRAAADAAMNDYENTIETLARSGAAVEWEDDMGGSGSDLVLGNYRRSGHRIYANGGKTVWQYYYLDFEEMLGGF